MLPQTTAGETGHRRRKRELEISAIVDTLRQYLPPERLEGENLPHILEFGSGDGFQIPYLKKLGKVAAIDLQLSDAVKAMTDIERYECSITHTPFRDQQFSLIFSNHVLEHIESLPEAFEEMKRIGEPGCLYAFSVPTDIWLLLSIPAQYYSKFKALFRKIQRAPRAGEKTQGTADLTEAVSPSQGHKGKSVFDLFGLHGHGVREDFGDCFAHFRIPCWKDLMEKNGFEILKVQPLLLYGPSEWPIIPTMKAWERWDLCSSVLFLSRHLIG